MSEKARAVYFGTNRKESKMAKLIWGSRFICWLRAAHRDEKGQVLVIAALTLPVLLGMGALAVDVGYVYVARTAMQNAADAGARAGAASLASGGQNQATLDATNFANLNLAQSSYLAGATPTVTFPDADSVQVTINHPTLPLFFARAIGFNTTVVNAAATASLQNVNSVDPGNLVPLAIYCNNPSGCGGSLSVGQNLSLRRYCGNFFQDGAGGNACGNTIADGENFLQGITFDNSNSNNAFRTAVRDGYDETVTLDQAARALPGNRNGWRSGMTDRLAEGRNEMTLAVIRELNPASGNFNISVVDFIQVRVSSFAISGNTDTTTFEIIRTAVSTTDFALSGEGLDINSVTGVRLTQ